LARQVLSYSLPLDPALARENLSSLRGTGRPRGWAGGAQPSSRRVLRYCRASEQYGASSSSASLPRSSSLRSAKLGSSIRRGVKWRGDLRVSRFVELGADSRPCPVYFDSATDRASELGASEARASRQARARAARAYSAAPSCSYSAILHDRSTIGRKCAGEWFAFSCRSEACRSVRRLDGLQLTAAEVRPLAAARAACADATCAAAAARARASLQGPSACRPDRS